MDQSVTATRSSSYVVDPNALIVSTSRIFRKVSRNGHCRLQVEKQLKGEKIVVRDPDSESEESEVESEGEIAESRSVCPLCRRKKKDEREGLTANQDTQTFKRCCIVAKRHRQRSIAFTAERAKRRFKVLSERDSTSEAPQQNPFHRSTLIPEHMRDNLFWCLKPVSTDKFCSVRYAGKLEGRKHGVMNIHKVLRTPTRSPLCLCLNLGNTYLARTPL